MDTKSNGFSTRKSTKIGAFILLVVLMTSVITQFLFALHKNYSFETVFSSEYIHSDSYYSYVNAAIGNVYNALTLRDSNAVKPNVYEVKKGEAYVEDEGILNIGYLDYFTAGKEYIDGTFEGIIDINELEKYTACADYIVAYRDYIAEMIERRIEFFGDSENRNSEIYYIRAYRDYINSVITYKGILDYEIIDKIQGRHGVLQFYYYATNGEQTFSNTAFTDKADFLRFSNEVYIYEKGTWEKSNGALYERLRSSQWMSDFPKYTFYIAFDSGSIAEIQAKWDSIRYEELMLFANIVGQIVAGVIVFIFLVVITGRKSGNSQVQLSRIDGVYSDILLAAAFAVFGIMIGVGSEMGYSYSYGGYRYGSGATDAGYIFALVLNGILVAVCSAVCVYICLSLVRKIKAGRLLRHSLIFTVLFGIYDFFKSIFDGRKFANYPLTKSLFYRQIAFIAASAVLVFFTVVFAAAGTAAVLFPPVLGIAVIYWYIKGNNKTFEEINKGFNESLEDQMRAERMKIALVTNVSHDLKTPLTSIISYVDLLSKEVKAQNFTNVNEYIDILAEKSDRLKHIVSDLFDLAKSTSGNISMDFETLDMVKLVEQTLADMSDKIETTQLQLKVSLPKQPLLVRSDGKKLYRVLQNVIDNAIKYSLTGTRIFVELAEVDREAVISIKNTAAYEMDFTAEEVLGRFTRGDKSRSTEGSGLGLSIAESFTNACGGSFNLSIDGDQFKIFIKLPM